MSEHTKEPWVMKKLTTSVGYCYKVGSQEMVDAKYGGICLYDDSKSHNPHTAGEQQANASRIVACVNACAGIDNITLENAALIPRVKATFDALMDSHAYNKQLQSANAELVEALEKHGSHTAKCYQTFSDEDWYCTCGLDAALAKHKGGGK